MNPRIAAAALASGVVISLTALSGGAAPALAKPDKDPVAPTETVLPSPPQGGSGSEVEVRERPAERKASAPEALPPVQAPVVVEPEPVVEAPPAVREPVAPEPVIQAPVAPEPAVEAPPVVEEPAVADPPRAEKPLPAATPTPVERPAPVEKPAQVAKPSPAEAPAPAAKPAPVEEPAPAVKPAPVEEPAAGAPPVVPAPAAPGEVTPESPADRAESREPKSPEAPDSPPGQSPEAPESPAGKAPEDPAAKSPEKESPAADAPEAAQAIREVRPETLLAPEEDVQVARRAEPVVQKVVEAPRQELDTLSRAVFSSERRDRDRDDWDRDRWDWDKDRWDKDRWEKDRWDRDRDRHWDRKVRQWNRDWVEYDRFYRPTFFNPYRNPVRIVYVYLNRPRIVYIPPLARIVLEAAEFAAYSFTAVVLGAADTAVDVAVGTFFGGGYVPRPGLPFPQPPRLVRYDNVPVQVRYPQAVYQPFRVNRIVDMGEDARFGERKVLLDGATPAWGVWTQNPSGERQFEVHRTQQFPGLDEPQAAPLPGDYPLRLAADESSPVDRTQVALYAAAGAVGALGFAALGMAVYLGRRRPQP
ncbi:hypothetical protein O6P37_06220 [Mycobacterium sp. CPCC 205372]|uniref:Uncharacterized protein n=1 Tax=Mycobacterium hippophais TaxID=3016340 RepID=A0ABT4PPI5_9MYCO|nr:hypothetical protein [Mycobacterium hippophais]MCZ8378452.1 hypothetical protein [Mycobacterium hippophais]